MPVMETPSANDAFLSLSPEVRSFFMSPPPPAFAAQDYVFATEFDAASASSSFLPTLDFPQLAQEYPPLMSPEFMQLFNPSTPADPLAPLPLAPQFMAVAQDLISHPCSLTFPSDLLSQLATPSDCSLISHPTLEIKDCTPTSSWTSYMEEVLSHPLPFQQSHPLQFSSLKAVLLPSATPNGPPTLEIKQEPYSPSSAVSSVPSSAPTSPTTPTSPPSPMTSLLSGAPPSSALQKLHQRLLQRLRKSQAESPTPPPSPPFDPSPLPSEDEVVIVSESSKKADSSFAKVLELFSYYFNTQKTASPLACTAALYLGQVGFELQKRYDAYSRYTKCGVLDESLISAPRAARLRKLGIKSYEEFLRAEVSELRRIKDPERYLNRRMQVFQSYEPEELEGVYLSFDALYLLAKKPPSFRKEWLEEGKVRIVHICEIHEAWRASPLNKTKRARSPDSEESCDSNQKPAKALKAER